MKQARVLLRSCVLLLACAVAACQGSVCAPPLADLKLEDEPTGFYVRLTINGAPAKLLLDTGSPQSLLTSDAVRRLGMSTEHLLDDTEVMNGFAINGVGGRRHIDRAWTHIVKLGDAPILSQPFAVVWSRDTGWDPSGDGILGMDVLSRYDLDLDVPHLRLGLYEPGGMCPASRPQTVLALSASPASLPITRVGIGGARFDALIDTGAQRSFILTGAAARLDAVSRPKLVDAGFDVFGVGPGHATAVLRDFDAVTLGDILIPRLQMAVIAPSGFAPLDVVVGADVLRAVHVWLFSAGRRMVMAGK